MDRNTGQRAFGEVRGRSLSLSQLSIKHLWMLVPALVVVWMGFMHPLRLLDFWWNLKVGEVIVTSGQIPRVDLFSFTHAGQPFVYQMWLGGVLYYLMHQIGGHPLVITFNTVLLLLAFAFTFHLCVQAATGVRMAALCSLAAAIVLGWYSNVRPQVYSFTLFAAFYWILWAYRDGRRDFLWALPLLMALWVNLHGAFVLGIGLVALVLGTEAIWRVVRGAHADTLAPSALAKLAVILVLTVLACVVNPEGAQVYAYVRQLQVDPSVQQFVAEWQVPDIKNARDVLAFFGPFFLALLVLFYARRRLSLTELGLFLAFAVLALGARRHGIWFTLIVTPMLARHLAQVEIPNLLDELRLQPYLRTLIRRLERRRQSRGPTRYRLNWMILIFLVLFTVMLSPWVRPHLEVERLRPQLVEKGTPVGAMDYIAERGLVGNIFHPQAYGDYLIWRLYPDQRSFFDGRVHLFDGAFVAEYIRTFRDEQWESRLAKYDIKYLLLPEDDWNSKAMIEDAQGSTDWTLLYQDDVSVLFEKQP